VDAEALIIGEATDRVLAGESPYSVTKDLRERRSGVSAVEAHGDALNRRADIDTSRWRDRRQAPLRELAAVARADDPPARLRG
jgi:hypothetical protein